MTVRTKYFYGIDESAIGPNRHAFFWPESPSKRRELMSVKRNMPDVYQSVYQCRPGSRTGSIFVEDDFSYFEPPPHMDAGYVDVETRKILERGHLVACAWDTAFESTSAANHTVCITGLLMPCDKYHRGENPELYGECEPHFDVLILDVFREKLAWGDLVGKFRLIHRKWLPSMHLVEQKGAGISLYQSMQSVGITIEGVEAKESKRARAVEGTSAGSVQGWFRQHRVQFPYRSEWLERLETELKDFTGDKAGSDDQVDALVHLVNYAIKLSQTMSLLPSEWTLGNVDDLMGVHDGIELDSLGVPEHMMHAIEAVNFITLAPQYSDDPGDGFCCRCIHQALGFCDVQKRLVAAFDSCSEYATEIDADAAL